MIILVSVILTELTSNEKNPLADGQARIKHQRLFLNELAA